MATTIYKWQVWCDTESAWETIWSDVEPTTCPNNVAHVIDQSRTTILEQVTENFPTSDIGTKIWVHSSTKPQHPNKVFFVQWVGAGDDMATGKIGDGDILHIDLDAGTPSAYRDIKFHPKNGEVYIHEGYCSWINANPGDYLDVLVMAEPSPLQTMVNKDLLITQFNEVIYSPNGPGTGTHGFAGQPHLVDRKFLKEGNWDYDPNNGLRPNFTQTGQYDIFSTEEVVYRLVTRIPVVGTTTTPFRLVSEDTTEIPPNYFIRVKATNVSNTKWCANVILTIYRENTYTPEKVI